MIVSRYVIALTSCLCVGQPLAASAEDQADPTFNGIIKAVNCEFTGVAVCNPETCAPLPRAMGLISFDFVKRTWRSPTLHGPLTITDVSPPIVGKPLKTDFSLYFNAEIGELKFVTIAFNSNALQNGIALVARSSVDLPETAIIWSGTCQIDPLAR